VEYEKHHLLHHEGRHDQMFVQGLRRELRQQKASRPELPEAYLHSPNIE
jgi:hypothetical protein